MSAGFSPPLDGKICGAAPTPTAHASGSTYVRAQTQTAHASGCCRNLQTASLQAQQQTTRPRRCVRMPAHASPNHREKERHPHTARCALPHCNVSHVGQLAALPDRFCSVFHRLDLLHELRVCGQSPMAPRHSRAGSWTVCRWQWVAAAAAPLDNMPVAMGGSGCGAAGQGRGASSVQSSVCRTRLVWFRADGMRRTHCTALHGPGRKTAAAVRWPTNDSVRSVQGVRPGPAVAELCNCTASEPFWGPTVAELDVFEFVDLRVAVCGALPAHRRARVPLHTQNSSAQLGRVAAQSRCCWQGLLPTPSSTRPGRRRTPGRKRRWW